MSYFLAKTDPDSYSIDQFAEEQKTLWDGVKNSQALQAIRQMRPKDRVFIYHSMGQSAVVGLAEVASAPVADPKDPKLAAVTLRYLRKLEPAVALSEIKNTGLFDDWALIRQSRLSTMTVPDSFVHWMRAKFPKAKI